MTARAQTLEKIPSFTEEGYKYGFFIDIESEQAPLGLNEDTVRFISAKKEEPQWLQLHDQGDSGVRCGRWDGANDFASGSQVSLFSMEVRVSNQIECLVTFPVKSGIFGVGRLATRLTALAASHEIGEWHIGHWVDWRHTGIRINFDTAADAALAKSTFYEAATATP